MTKTELERLTEWGDNDLGTLRLQVPVLSAEATFVLFPVQHARPEVTDKMADTVNDVLRLKPDALDVIKAMLWEECRFAFHVADYGVEIEPGETSLQAHMREFGVSSDEDALRKARLHEIHITEDFPSRYAQIKYDTVANNLISVIIKNGRIIDWDDDGTHLGWFEKNEQHARDKRKKILAD